MACSCIGAIALLSLATRPANLLFAIINLITSEVGMQNSLLKSQRRKLSQPLGHYALDYTIVYRLAPDVVNYCHHGYGSKNHVRSAPRV